MEKKTKTNSRFEREKKERRIFVTCINIHLLGIFKSFSTQFQLDMVVGLNRIVKQLQLSVREMVWISREWKLNETRTFELERDVIVMKSYFAEQEKCAQVSSKKKHMEEKSIHAFQIIRCRTVNISGMFILRTVCFCVISSAFHLGQSWSEFAI